MAERKEVKGGYSSSLVCVQCNACELSILEHGKKQREESFSAACRGDSEYIPGVKNSLGSPKNASWGKGIRSPQNEADSRSPNHNPRPSTAATEQTALLPGNTEGAEY